MSITTEELSKGLFLASLAVTAIVGLCVLAVALWEEMTDGCEDPIGGIGDEGESEPKPDFMLADGSATKGASTGDKGEYFTPPEVLDEVAKAHPIDPACGTGAFLNGKEAN